MNTLLESTRGIHAVHAESLPATGAIPMVEADQPVGIDKVTEGIDAVAKRDLGNERIARPYELATPDMTSEPVDDTVSENDVPDRAKGYMPAISIGTELETRGNTVLNRVLTVAVDRQLNGTLHYTPASELLHPAAETISTQETTRRGVLRGLLGRTITLPVGNHSENGSEFTPLPVNFADAVLLRKKLSEKSFWEIADIEGVDQTSIRVLTNLALAPEATTNDWGLQAARAILAQKYSKAGAGVLEGIPIEAITARYPEAVRDIEAEVKREVAERSRRAGLLSVLATKAAVEAAHRSDATAEAPERIAAAS
ncbi:MAG: hypothetical protein JWL85_177 [Candidatus Saccharibacteria bacterium]|nr:hypothetical protein [Candidatus Saccharibacteria bacterium]